MALTVEKAPQSNGCFEICAASPTATPWPPPPVTEKNYEPVVGTLLWSKFNGDRRLAGPTVDEMMCSLGDLVDLLATGDEDAFEAAVVAETSRRRKAWAKPKEKQKEPSGGA